MAVYQVILRSAGEMEATPAAWAPLPLHPALEEEAAIEPSVYAWLAAAVDAAPCPTALEDFVESAKLSNAKAKTNNCSMHGTS